MLTPFCVMTMVVSSNVMAHCMDVFEKYEINATAQGWNNFGDYLQALAVFYYECASHIMLPSEITD